MADKMNEESLLEMIETCRDEGDERLHVLREVYCTHFEPNEEFWSAWLTDAIVTKDVAYIDHVFSRAVQHCPTLSFVTEYSDVMIRFAEEDLITEDKLRESFEKCLAIVGCDLHSGGIWEQYTEFEIDELMDAMEVGDNNAITAAKMRVVKLFRRQLGTPLLNHHQILSKFDACLSEHFLQSDEVIIQPASIEALCQKSQEMFEARILYEEALQSSDMDALVKTYITYATFEANDNCPARAQRVFERGVLQCRESRELWLCYIEFVSYTLQNIEALSLITERAIKLINGDAEIALYRFIALSKSTHQNNEENTADEVAFAFDRFCSSYHAPRNGNGEDVLSVMFSHCQIYRSRLLVLLDAPLSSQQALQAVATLRSALTSSADFLQKQFPQKEEIYVKFVEYWCNVEDDVIADVAEALESAGESSLTSQSGHVWESALKLYPKSTSAWNGYLKWAKSGGEDAVDAVRKLYKKWLSQIIGDDATTVEVLRQWLRYEQHIGDATAVLTVLQRAKAFRSAVVGVEAVAVKQPAARKSKSSAGDRNDPPAKRAKPNNDRHVAAAAAAAATTSTITKTVTSESVVAQEVTSSEATNAVSSLKNAPDVKGVSAEMTSSEATKAVSSSKNAPDVKTNSADIQPTHDNTIFIKNLSFTATDSDVCEAFVHCGEILRVEMLLSKAGKSRGMALVTFASSQSVPKAQHMNNKSICGRPITVNPYHDHTDADDTYDAKTVFISRLARDVSENDIKNFFETRVGAVDGIKIMTDKMSGVSKGFALVQFVNEESVPAALALNGSTPEKSDTSFLLLQGKHLSVEKSKYPAISPLAVSKPATSSVSGSKNLAAFKPRNLRIKQDEPKTERKPHLAVVAPSDDISSERVISESGGKTNADFRKYF